MISGLIIPLDGQESLKLTPAMYVLLHVFERYDGTHLDSYTQRGERVRSSHETHSPALITPTVSLIPLMVTRLLLSLRKASDPKTIAQWNMDHFTSPRTFTTVTTTEGHYTPSNTPDSAMTRVSQYDVLDSVFELSDLSSQDERHPGASDGKV